MGVGPCPSVPDWSGGGRRCRKSRRRRPPAGATDGLTSRKVTSPWLERWAACAGWEWNRTAKSRGDAPLRSCETEPMKSSCCWPSLAMWSRPNRMELGTGGEPTGGCPDEEPGDCRNRPKRRSWQPCCNGRVQPRNCRGKRPGRAMRRSAPNTDGEDGLQIPDGEPNWQQLPDGNQRQPCPDGRAAYRENRPVMESRSCAWKRPIGIEKRPSIFCAICQWSRRWRRRRWTGPASSSYLCPGRRSGAAPWRNTCWATSCGGSSSAILVCCPGSKGSSSWWTRRCRWVSGASRRCSEWPSWWGRCRRRAASRSSCSSRRRRRPSFRCPTMTCCLQSLRRLCCRFCGSCRTICCRPCSGWRCWKTLRSSWDPWCWPLLRFRRNGAGWTLPCPRRRDPAPRRCRRRRLRCCHCTRSPSCRPSTTWTSPAWGAAASAGGCGTGPTRGGGDDGSPSPGGATRWRMMAVHGPWPVVAEIAGPPLWPSCPSDLDQKPVRLSISSDALPVFRSTCSLDSCHFAVFLFFTLLAEGNKIVNEIVEKKLTDHKRSNGEIATLGLVRNGTSRGLSWWALARRVMPSRDAVRVFNVFRKGADPPFFWLSLFVCPLEDSTRKGQSPAADGPPIAKQMGGTYAGRKGDVAWASRERVGRQSPPTCNNIFIQYCYYYVGTTHETRWKAARTHLFFFFLCVYFIPSTHTYYMDSLGTHIFGSPPAYNIDKYFLIFWDPKVPPAFSTRFPNLFSPRLFILLDKSIAQLENKRRGGGRLIVGISRDRICFTWRSLG